MIDFSTFNLFFLSGSGSSGSSDSSSSEGEDTSEVSDSLDHPQTQTSTSGNQKPKSVTFGDQSASSFSQAEQEQPMIGVTPGQVTSDISDSSDRAVISGGAALGGENSSAVSAAPANASAVEAATRKSSTAKAERKWTAANLQPGQTNAASNNFEKVRHVIMLIS